MDKKSVFLYINAGFAHRYLLRSNIFQTLKKEKDLHLIILTHNANEPGFREMYESDNVSVELVEEDHYNNYLQTNKLLRIFIQIRAHVLNGSGKINTVTIDDFRSIFIVKNGWILKNGLLNYLTGLFFIAATEIFKHSKVLRNLLIHLEQRLFSPNVHQDLFEKYLPSLVIVTGLTGFLYNEFIAREAKRNNVKICNIVLSWDNTSGNGMPGYIPDYVIAWTDNMKDELIELNDIPSDIIYIGGVAHWDSYYDQGFLFTKGKLFRLLGLDPNKNTIFYATKSPRRFPWGPDLIEEIAKFINKGEIRDAQLLVRVHPLHYRRLEGKFTYQAIIDQYEEVANRYDCIILNTPETVSQEMDFDMADSETKLVASILKHSSVMINMFSTMAIEAAIFDLPIINMAIRDICKGDVTNTKQDIMIDYRQSHNQRIIQSGGCRTAFSFSELKQYLHLYLEKPNVNSDGLASIRKHEAGPFPGSAGENIANLIVNILNAQN